MAAMTDERAVMWGVVAEADALALSTGTIKRTNNTVLR